MPDRDVAQIRAIAREFRMSRTERYKFGDYIEECIRRAATSARAKMATSLTPSCGIKCQSSVGRSRRDS